MLQSLFFFSGITTSIILGVILNPLIDYIFDNYLIIQIYQTVVLQSLQQNEKQILERALVHYQLLNSVKNLLVINLHVHELWQRICFRMRPFEYCAPLSIKPVIGSKGRNNICTSSEQAGESKLGWNHTHTSLNKDYNKDL